MDPMAPGMFIHPTGRQSPPCLEGQHVRHLGKHRLKRFLGQGHRGRRTWTVRCGRFRPPSTEQVRGHKVTLLVRDHLVIGQNMSEQKWHPKK